MFACVRMCAFVGCVCVPQKFQLVNHFECMWQNVKLELEIGNVFDDFFSSFVEMILTGGNCCRKCNLMTPQIIGNCERSDE